MDSQTLTLEAGQPPRRRGVGEVTGSVLAEVWRDAPLLTIVGVYVLAAWLLSTAGGRPEYYHPFLYMKLWWSGLTTGLGVFALAYELPMAVLSQPRRPLRAFEQRMRGWISARAVAGLLLFFAAGLFTGAFTTIKTLMNEMVAFGADGLLAKVDAVLHLGVDPWRLLQPLMGHEAVTRVVQKLYLAGWGFLIVSFTAAAALSPRLAHVRTRFFLIYFAAWILLGNVLAAAFMSGGPVYYGQITGDHVRFAEQMAYLSFSHGMPNSSFDLQKALWKLYEYKQFYRGTGISAFPSLHVAMMTLFTLTAFQIDRRLGWAVGAFAALILASSVHLAWHYAIDGYASAAFVILAWVAYGRLTARPAP